MPLSEATVNYSDVQGGWSGPGANNIDADPLFVDPEGPDDIPGTQDDNLRLLPPSPAIDAADNTAVPSDSSDLDDDGDTNEPVPFDLDGTPRIVDVPCVSNSGNPPGAEAIVDMGAYEQEFAFNDCNDNGEDDICDLIDGISEDCNGNGVPDECQDTSADCNDNGIWDACDIAAGTREDCNGNGVPDECDISDRTSEDCNGDGVPDECGLDCNGNGVADSCDIAEGTSQDCNGNGVPDECDIAEGTGEDCNGNEIHDQCDIADGTSEDCTGNGVPDECESDCNENGQADSCDIADGTGQDCGGEGIPDDCTENPGPVIFAQPASQDAETGDFVLFAVGADGVLLEYQWRKDGENLVDDDRIFGAQSPGLIILDVEPADAGAYDCMVTDFAGDCALSNPATLTVTDSCPADFDGDGTVGASDLAQLLGSWGQCDDCDNCSANFNEDCMVTAADLAQLLGDWGPCQ